MSRRLVLAMLLVAVFWGTLEAKTWGWLGVRIRDITEQEMEEISSRHGIREGFGAMIVEVLAETPAARHGLKPGDLVVAFKDRPVVDTRLLQRLVAATPAGEEVVLTVLRGEEGRRKVSVRVGLMPPEVVAERVAAEFGFVIRDVAQERPGSPARQAGVPTVATVLKGSEAERAGLKLDDRIVEVNGRPVHSRQAVSEALAEATIEQPLTLTVRRGEERVRLTLAPATSRLP